MGKSLVQQAMEHLGKDWSKSSMTRVKNLGNTKEFARFVAGRYGLEKIDNLKPAMVQGYIDSLRERGLSPSTCAGKLTAVRQVAASIGKQNIVHRENKDYGIERTRINPQVVSHDRLAVVRQAISARADQGDKVAIMTMAADSLRTEFGLRAKESLLSCRVELKGGKLMLSVEGAKGGRPREMEVKTEGQLRAVQLVAETAKLLGSATGRIIPINMSLKEAYNGQRNLWRECGGTRASGSNMHGERHAYVRERSAEGATTQEIMAETGHGAERSAAPYLPKS